MIDVGSPGIPPVRNDIPSTRTLHLDSSCAEAGRVLGSRISNLE